MKPFRFPLQAVLTLRLNQENKALEAFALAQAEVERNASQVRQLRQEIDETLACRRDVLKSAASSEDLQQIQHGLRTLQDALRRWQADLQKAQAVLDEKSQIMLKARQEREIVEKVYHRQLARHKVQAARLEQKALDEIATLKSIGNFALKWR
ncbi:MAG: flagellar export protein FliJ [Verrucomicrobia bacterium]|nr:flagellar export protein FliJ [Verrucomicrobiota bacterium]